VVLENESRETFQTLLDQHLDRLRPVDGVEVGMIEEMVASHWRLRRAWAMETRMLDNEIAAQPDSKLDHDDPTGAELDRIGKAFTAPVVSASIALMNRYENRLHLMYQRALHNIVLLRIADPPNPVTQNEPNPISGHSGEILELLPAPPTSADTPNS
jgi:hypothetical protein